MEAIRTPDERFVGLVEYPFAANYIEIATEDNSSDAPLRVHYLDEGPRDAHETMLLLHGEPSWSYLYRKMIPILAAAGHRVIAPDLVGFGKSDKPTSRSDYTYARHVAWMKALLFDHLDLEGITFFGQDWGGLIGLRLAGEHPERYRRIAVGNTFLPSGDTTPPEAFFNWQRFSQDVPEMPIGLIINGGTTSALSHEVISAYDAPFPDERYKEGARQFPMLVPTRPDDPASAANRAAWSVLSELDIPVLCAFSDSDPVTAGADRAFLRDFVGTKGQAHVTITEAGHFLQEDKGEQLAGVLCEFIANNP